MATQAEILTMVRGRLDEVTATYWTDEQLRTWVNEGARDIARRTESIRTNSTVAVVANTSSYTFAPTPPPVRIHTADFTPTGQTNVIQLTYRDRMAMNEVWGSWQNTNRGYPQFATWWGSPDLTFTVQLYPVPSIAGVLRVWYYRFPTQLTTSSNASSASTVEIPGGWEDLIVDCAEYKALRKDRDPAWQEAKQEYEQHLSALNDAAVRFTDQAGLVTTDTGVMLPSWAYAGDGEW